MTCMVLLAAVVTVWIRSPRHTDVLAFFTPEGRLQGMAGDRGAVELVELGWNRLPADMSEFEITHLFSLRPEERSAVLTRYRDSLRFRAGLWLACSWQAFCSNS